MRTWTLRENYEWIRTLSQDQSDHMWDVIAEAFDNGATNTEVNTALNNVRRQTQPTWGQMLLGIPLLVMGVVAAWDASNVLIDLPKATRNLANMKD